MFDEHIEDKLQGLKESNHTAFHDVAEIFEHVKEVLHEATRVLHQSAHAYDALAAEVRDLKAKVGITGKGPKLNWSDR